MVEHLKVMAALSVEPAYAFNLLIGPSNKSKNGRAPKGDGGQSSLLAHPYQSSPLKGDGGLSMAALSVEHLKVMAASRACLRIL